MPNRMRSFRNLCAVIRWWALAAAWLALIFGLTKQNGCCLAQGRQADAKAAKAELPEGVIVRLGEPRSEQELWIGRGWQAPVAYALFPTEPKAVVSYDDGSIVLMDFKQGKLIHTWRSSNQTPPRRTTRIAISKDGKRLPQPASPS